MRNVVPLILLLIALSGCLTKKPPTATGPSPTPMAQISRSASSLSGWQEALTPHPAANITSAGKVFWVCGADEMIASSSDGGVTWQLKHEKVDGQILLNIAFVNEKVGHAAGNGGLILTTVDGGSTWTAHNIGDDIREFSFADSENGIAIIGGDSTAITFKPTWGEFGPMDGAVKLTHDGGEHWEDIPSLNSEELRPYPLTVAIAALDTSHYLMIRRQPAVEDIYLVSDDAGKSWQVVHPRNDSTNRELPRRVFVHAGEYWIFGMELVNRQQGGGYGVPLTLHSKDGHTWTHGVNGGLHEYGGCNSEGCYMWDGTVETLYGEKERYWALPQDFTLSDKWAIAANRACTINSVTECGPAVATEQPQPRPKAYGEFDLKPSKLINLAFAHDCVVCGVKAIWPDPGLNWRGKITMNLTLANDGTVTDLSLNGVPHNRFVEEQIRNQIERWQFKAGRGGHKNVAIDVKCFDVPDAPPINGCWLTPSRKSS